MKFELDEIEIKNFEKFKKSINKKVKNKGLDSNGTYSIEFIMSGIGIAIIANHSSGEWKNITNYKNW